MAEAQRFELWNPFGSPVFKTKSNDFIIRMLWCIHRIKSFFYTTINQSVTVNAWALFFQLLRVLP
ncbi:TPA: hypothetical protein MHW31_22235 [Klebsiella pneumoniae]|nr:hypothetical protein AXA58_01820 [Klebsiella pneumoniae]MBX4503516.1 hypothetical protein [Klebsiella pneumoniae]RZM67785.1 hypothetical protein C1164_12465 [Klebsiella pneumoniae]HBX2952483.1 hypothetical protein [Klebsiella pneumoniae]HBX3266166.1 hypothetical protein [Klebsiella pneumoniae]